jgi:hypothetical protein
MNRGEVLYAPQDGDSADRGFLTHIQGAVTPSVVDYSSLHAWSIADPGMFWSKISERFNVKLEQQILVTDTDPELLSHAPLGLT